MTTKKNVGTAVKNSTHKSNKANGTKVAAEQIKNNEHSAEQIAAAVAVEVAHKENGHQPAADQLAAAMVADTMAAEPANVRELAAAILAEFSGPRFEDSEEYAAVAAAVAALPADLSEKMLNAARLTWSKRPENVAPACCAADVLAAAAARAEIFTKVCGCAVPEQITQYTLTALPLGTIRANSAAADYVTAAAVPADATPAALVSALLSVRHLVNVERSISAARSAEAASLRASLANFARAAARLGWDAERLAAEAVAAYNHADTTDGKQRKQLRTNIAALRANERELEAAVITIRQQTGRKDDNGTTYAAKVAKLNARRRRALSAIATAEALLA